MMNKMKGQKSLSYQLNHEPFERYMCPVHLWLHCVCFGQFLTWQI